MRKLAVIYLVLFAVLFGAWQCFATQVTLTGAGSPGGGGGYQGPADIVASPVVCFSMFACSNLIATTGTQPLVALNNGTNTCNFLTASTGGLGLTASTTGAVGGSTGVTLGPTCTPGQSVSTFCGTCTVAVFYNQGTTGVGHMSRTSSPPTFVASQIGGFPAIVATTSTGGMDGNASMGFTCGSPPCIFSTSSVFQRTVTSNGQTIWAMQVVGTSLLYASSTGILTYQSSASITTTTNDNLPHHSQVIFNASGTTAGTSVYIDGGSAQQVSGGTTRGLGADQPVVLEPVNGTTNQCQCAVGEFVVWNADNTSQMSTLYTKTHSRWGNF